MAQAVGEVVRVGDIGKKIDALGNSASLLAIANPDHVRNALSAVVRHLAGKGLPGLFISFNKPYLSVKADMEKAGVRTENLFFVDCVSSTAGIEERSDDVLFLNSAANLTGLSIGLTQFIEAIPGDKFVIIDTLQTLSIYLDSNTIASFVRSITAKASKYPMVLVTVSTPNPANDKIIPFFDKVIEVEDGS